MARSHRRDIKKDNAGFLCQQVKERIRPQLRGARDSVQTISRLSQVV